MKTYNKSNRYNNNGHNGQNKNSKKGKTYAQLMESTTLLSDFYRLEERICKAFRAVNGASDEQSEMIREHTDGVERLIMSLITDAALSHSCEK